MNILVTGGAGFIGSHLCEKLLSLDHAVVCVDNFDDFYDPSIKRQNVEKSLSSKAFQLKEGDILNVPFLGKIFSDSAIDLVIHLAARAGVRPSIANPSLYQKVNIEGTLNVLDMMRTHGVRRMIMASSSSVYGNNEKVPYSETDNVDHAISPYAATKKACEVLAYTFHHLFGLDVFCLRFFTVYGPRQRPEMAIHKFARQIDRGEAITLFGDGSSSRDYTYIDDIINGLAKCLDRVSGYEIINLGESRTTTLTHLVELIEQVLGKKAKINRLPMQAGDVMTTYADIQRAKSIIGYDPKIPIEDGIRKFVQWYRTSQ